MWTFSWIIQGTSSLVFSWEGECQNQVSSYFLFEIAWISSFQLKMLLSPQGCPFLSPSRFPPLPFFSLSPPRVPTCLVPALLQASPYRDSTNSTLVAYKNLVIKNNFNVDARIQFDVRILARTLCLTWSTKNNSIACVANMAHENHERLRATVVSCDN